MIPMLMTIAVRHEVIDHETGRLEPEGRGLRLWLPLFLLWLVIAPFALLLAPLIIIALAWFRANPFQIIARVFDLLSALTGTLVEVEAPGALVKIRIL